MIRLTSKPVPAGRHPAYPSAARGQELAEFAIIVPVILLIVFAVLDLARAFSMMVSITSAAREGARYASFYGLQWNNTTSLWELKTADIVAATRSEAANSGVDLSGASVVPTCPSGTCGSGQPVRVTITYSLKLIMGWILPSPLTLSRYAEMMAP
jgi:hypothetical protein